MSDRFGMTDNYLVHSAKGTTWEKKDHKWVFRKRGKNGKWRYFYTVKELEKAEKDLEDSQRETQELGKRYRSKYTLNRINSLNKYKRGEYFDKDSGNIDAYYQNESQALQRMRADYKKAQNKETDAKKKYDSIRYTKTGTTAANILDIKKKVDSVLGNVGKGVIYIDGTGYQIIPNLKRK